MTTEVPAIRLKEAKDWPRWIATLKGYAISRKVWDYVDPDNTKWKPHVEPILPTIGDDATDTQPTTRVGQRLEDYKINVIIYKDNHDRYIREVQQVYD